MRIEPNAQVVSCSYCHLSSFVHRPREPVAPAPPTYGHINLSDKQLRSGGAALIPIAIAGMLVVAGIGAALVMLRRPAPSQIAPLAPPKQPAELPGSTPGPACEKAVQCCKAVVSISGDASAARSCEALRALPDADCVKQHASLRSSAKSMGRSCP
jgi:hypothetical protein